MQIVRPRHKWQKIAEYQIMPKQQDSNLVFQVVIHIFSKIFHVTRQIF